MSDYRTQIWYNNEITKQIKDKKIKETFKINYADL